MHCKRGTLLAHKPAHHDLQSLESLSTLQLTVKTCFMSDFSFSAHLLLKLDICEVSNASLDVEPL